MPCRRTLCYALRAPLTPQMAFGVIVSMFAGALLLRLRPYVKDADDALAATGMWVFCAMNLAFLLKRMQEQLKQSGDFIAGQDQDFDFAPIQQVAYVGLFIVPALAIALSVVEAAIGAWEDLLEQHEGTAVAEELKAAPMWRRPLLVLGFGTPAPAGSAGSTTPSTTPANAPVGPVASTGGAAAMTPPVSSAAAAAAGPPPGTQTVPPPSPPVQARPRTTTPAMQAVRRASRVRVINSMVPVFGRGAGPAARPAAASVSAWPSSAVLPPGPLGPGSTGASQRALSATNPLFVRSRIRRTSGVEGATP
jgi:hypothetical protein